jgi:hypothetical protein
MAAALEVVTNLPLLLAAGWVVRVPLLSPTEGHEAVTRAGWEGLALTDSQRGALILGVRSPDVSIRGLAVFALPSRQARHALRGWPSSTTQEAVRAMRAFVTERHLRALALPDGRRRWEAFGEILHCLQDAYSPAHVERDGPRILRMKHWGPLHRGRDEHGFPSDPRDRALVKGTLTDAARAAADVTGRYLELALGHGAARDRADATIRWELSAFLDTWVTGPTDTIG